MSFFGRGMERWKQAGLSAGTSGKAMGIAVPFLEGEGLFW